MPQWAAFYKIKPDKMKNLPVIQRILILRQEVFQIRTIRRGSMVKLLIIADDFTGALDTGVQFAAVERPPESSRIRPLPLPGRSPACRYWCWTPRPGTWLRSRLTQWCGRLRSVRWRRMWNVFTKRPIRRCGAISGQSWRRNGCGRRRSAPLYPCVPQDSSHDKGWSPFDRRGAGGAERVRAGPL